MKIRFLCAEKTYKKLFLQSLHLDMNSRAGEERTKQETKYKVEGRKH